MSSKTTSRIKTASSALSLAAAIGLLVAPGSTIAGSFTWDGVKDAPGAPDMYTRSFEADWFNGHDTTRYGVGDGQKTTVYFGTGQEGGAGPDFNWLFLEAPLTAKYMVYGDEFNDDLNDFGTTDEVFYDKDSLDFGGATGSEKVIFGGTKTVTPGNDGKDDIDWSNEVELDFAEGPGFTDNSVWNVIGFKDSVDYLKGAGSDECGIGTDPNTDCGARSRTMSFEIKLGAVDFDALKLSIQTSGIDFHLSPDGFAESVSEVPVPAAFWLFGSALIGFIGFSRRTNLG